MSFTLKSEVVRGGGWFVNFYVYKNKEVRHTFFFMPT